MIRSLKSMLGMLAINAVFAVQAAAADDAEKRAQYTKQRDAIYEHMARYGINRDDIGAMRRLGRMWPNSNPYVDILAAKVLNPGEYYRFELDEFVFNMLVPDAPYMSSWITPYVNTRQLDPETEARLKLEKGAVQIANLGWHYGTGIWPLFVGWTGEMKVYINYRILKPEGKDNLSTPEKLRILSHEIIQSFIPSQAEIDEAIRERMILNRAGNRVYLDAESVVINGRVWVRDATNSSYGRNYSYKTSLSPGRMISIGFVMPQYDYNANPDLSSYPAALKRAFAQMDELVASLRITKVNDDGAPDPFVIERVEPTPLPLREKRDTP